VLLLLYGLLRSGQIVLRRIDGGHDMAKLNPQAKLHDSVKRKQCRTTTSS
jgi:hypothetical protein